MTTLILDRSTDEPSVAFQDASGALTTMPRDSVKDRTGEWVSHVTEFLGARRPSRILVGMGPGSFAGTRAALAFAQGYALGAECEVFGLPSPCAFAARDEKFAIVGDARRGLYWVALLDGFQLVKPIFQVSRENLAASVPENFAIFSPDAKRIDADLREIFRENYRGGAMPRAEGLAIFANENASALIREPLPLYLNPAVRT